MTHLPLWAAGTDLPVKALAAVGGFALGGFLGGWLLALAAKLAFNQKVPEWLAWIVRLLSGLAAGYAVWMMLGGNFGWGFGAGNGTGDGKEKGSFGEKRTDKAGKRDEERDPIPPPKDKEPDDKGKPAGPGIGSGESMRVEVLGNGPLEKLARGGKMDPERRYRVADAPATLRTFAEVKKLILDSRSQTPPLRHLDVVIYLDSPDQNSPPVRSLVDWARDIEPGVAGPLEVEEKVPPRSAPLK